jgi:P-type E1-E2 ATPase
VPADRADTAFCRHASADKANVTQDLQREWKIVAMVGDGINDSA